jgi:hypothetical protein
VKAGHEFAGEDVRPVRVSLSPFRIYNDEVTVVGSTAVLITSCPTET